MRKKIETDTWVNCPECKIKLKQENLTYHMKHVHNKKIDDLKEKPLENSHKKRQENKTNGFISKTTIIKITIIIIIVAASISVYFLFNSTDPNFVNNKKSYFVSVEGKGNYSSIQEAIDSASNNNTIFVSKGTYFENIKITKPINLIGENKNTTIINGNGSGIVINISANYVKITGFTIMNGGSMSADESNAGIKLGTSYNTISDCNISSNKNYGIYFYTLPETTNNIITNNTFSNNKYGIFAYYAKTNNISSNTFTNNTDYGIYIQASSNDNMISNNIFTKNNYAIRVKGSTINKIIKNQIMNNKNGLYFCCGAENNIAYNNVFINNTNWNANDALSNTWDNGIVGNYWDDYNGTDENGDGIGDTPYIINLKKGDNFPLMKPK